MVVVDSSVLIPLLRIGKLSILQKFFKKVTITQEVHEEIKQGKIGFYEFEKAFTSWIVVDRSKRKEEKKESFEHAIIGKADASLILLAKNKKDILLSNDAALILAARSEGVECWWLTTFILRCLKKRVLTKNEAKNLLFDLIEAGMRLENNVYAAMLKEIESR